MIEIIIGIMAIITFPIVLSWVAVLLIYLGLNVSRGISELYKLIKERDR